MFDSMFPSHWTTLRKLMWLKLKGASAVWATITGNPVSFSAKAAPLRQLKVAFSPKQDLHGYDSPWPAGGGKNLCHIDDFSTTIETCNISASGNVLTISGTPATSIGTQNDIWKNIKFHVYEEARYTLSWSTAPPTGIGTYVYDSDGNICPLYLNLPVGDYTVGVAVGSGNTYNFSAQLQVEKNSTATSFAPYSNICPILGWSDVTVYHSGADTSDPRSISISLGSTVYSGYVDVVTGVLTVDWASKTFNGDGDTYSAPSANRINVDFADVVYKKQAGGSSGISNLYYSWKQEASNNNFNNNTVDLTTCYDLSSGSNTVRIKDPRFTDLNTGKAILAENPLVVVMELATPIPIQLTPQEVQSLLGVNNMWSDANGDLTVEYRSN